MPDHPGFDAGRRRFLLSAPLFAATLLHCSNKLLDQTRLAQAFIVDPDWNAWRPVLDAVISAILPLERSDFPLRSTSVVRQQILAMFPLESSERFAGFQRTIAVFDQLDLFTIFSGPLMQQEAVARDVPQHGEAWDRMTAEIREADTRALDVFRREFRVAPQARFTELALPARRAYLGLWRNSASVVKRQFHGALRSLVMVSTYSMDETWAAIHYAGPLLPRKGTAS